MTLNLDSFSNLVTENVDNRLVGKDSWSTTLTGRPGGNRGPHQGLSAPSPTPWLGRPCRPYSAFARRESMNRSKPGRGGSGTRRRWRTRAAAAIAAIAVLALLGTACSTTDTTGA